VQDISPTSLGHLADLIMSNTFCVLQKIGTDYLSPEAGYFGSSPCVECVFCCCLSSFCFLCHVLYVSLDCSFLIVASVFSNIFYHYTVQT